MSYKMNLATLMSGNALAYAIQMFTLPILSRLYSPDEYGRLGLIMAVAGIVAISSTLSYSESIVFNKNKREMLKASFLCITIGISFSLLLIAIVFFINIFSNEEGIKDLIYFSYYVAAIPVVSSLSQIFRQWCNREGKYKFISSVQVFSVLITVSISISFPFMSLEGGLIYGWIVGSIIPAVCMIIILCHERSFSLVKVRHVWIYAQKNINYPKYIFPSEFIYTFSSQLPVYFLSSMSSMSSVGLYNRSRMLLNMPISFISNNIAMIYKKKASEIYRNTGECKSLFVKTFVGLFFISIIPFLIIIFFSENLIVFILGDSWIECVNYIRILSVMYYMNFLVSPLTSMYYICNSQREDFVTFVFLLVSIITFCYISFAISHDVLITLLVYSVVNSFFYLLKLVRSFQMASGS